MPSVDTYDASLTSVEVSAASTADAHVLPLTFDGSFCILTQTASRSAFFARPIAINPIFTQTVPLAMALATSPSPAVPTTQKRQVHLVCAGRTVCIATSSVTITSPRYAHLFLVEGYAIGQIFRKMEDIPAFELLDVGLVSDLDDSDCIDSIEKIGGDSSKEKRKLWRRYTLKVKGFFADIVEVFPDRSMFTRGEEWLCESQLLSIPFDDNDASSTPGLSPTDTLVHHDDLFEQAMRPANVKEAWSDSSNGLLRFMAVFIAVILLLAVPRDGDASPQGAGTLFGRIARLLDVQGGSEDS
ncbi:hypothetical protein EW145_g1696 [Phellinidium pouzarii]|uniref:Uncharacterized protein n=1 Tax=Phellinidium pouzarii TaxID=167371 RepID=A0A4S4LE29_9AGAM|nr:hypothetical protein EW145_g1696 [Phellinidium pouzarii]